MIGEDGMNNQISLKVSDTFEKEALDAFVHKSLNTSIFQTLDMAEVYKRNKGCKLLILTVIDENTDEIVASLLAKILDEKRGFLGSFSRHSTIRGGPIFVDNEKGTAAVSLLLQHYNRIVEKDVLYSRIYPLNDPQQIMSSFSESGYVHEGWQNFLIDINKPNEKLWSNLKKDKRQAVRKAERMGLKITEATDRSETAIFYDLVKERYVKRKTPLEDISNFEAVFDILVSESKAKFFFAKYGDEYIATRLVLLYKGVIYAWYSGSNSEYLQYHPNDFITWQVLKWGSENGFHTFDFGGGGTSDEISAGWVEFKRRFGGELVNYGRYTKVHQPGKLWFVKKAFEMYRRLFIH